MIIDSYSSRLKCHLRLPETKILKILISDQLIANGDLSALEFSMQIVFS